MLESRMRTYQSVIRFIDVVSCVLALLLSLRLIGAWPFIETEMGLTVANVRLLAVIVASLVGVVFVHLLLYAFCYACRGIYDLSLLSRHFLRAFCMLLFDCLLIHALTLAFDSVPLPIAFYFYYVVLGFSLIVGFNILIKALIAFYIRKRKAFINLLIIGTNRHAYGFYKLVTENKFLGYNVIGFVDNDNFGDYPITMLGDLEHFQEIIRDNVVDRGVVFLPIRSYNKEILEIISIAEAQGVALQLMNNIFETRMIYVSTTRMGNYSGVLFDVLPLYDWRLGVKRAFDVAFALLLLVLASPVLLAAIVAVKVHDKGPVFFRQPRVGYHKRVFTLFKLRTMNFDAEAMQRNLEQANEMDGPVFKIRNDPRITPVGRVLRRYGIDELPQLFNVFRGDMSIVGPRPLAMRDYKGFSEDWLRRRFSVRPGITCYWQSMPNRNDLSFNTWMQLDMDYIDNWTLTEDMKIILKTIPTVLSGTGR